MTVDEDAAATTESARARTRTTGGAGRGGGSRRGATAGGRGGGGDGGGGRDGRGTGRAMVAVDPRMRARRIGVRRDAGQRRLRRMTLVLLVVALLVGAAAATRSSLLDVDRVAVSGVERTTADEVRRAAAIPPDEPMVSVDVEAVRGRIEALPWVDHAEVVRAWPSTVNVQVRERVAAALVPVTGNHAALVDAEGRVLSIERTVPPAGDSPEAGQDGPEGGAPPAVPEGLALVTGVHGPVVAGGVLDDEARQALRVAVVTAERMPGTVASVSVELEAELVAGGMIRFGDADELDAKVTAAKTVLEQVDLACLAVLDVRVPGSPALTRHQGCS